MTGWTSNPEPGGITGHVSSATLSDYIDGQIGDAAELSRIRRHLTACAACREELAELSAVVGLLAELPPPTLPRSFRLTAELAPVRLVAPEPWFVRYQPVMRRLTAVAAMLLVFVVAADLLSGGSSQQDDAVFMARESVPEQQTSASSAGSTAATEEPTAAAAGGAVAPMAAASPAAAPATSSGASTSADAAAATPTSQPTPTATPTEVAPVETLDSAGDSETTAPDDESVWRLVETGLAALLFWLLIVTFGLPRARVWRASQRGGTT